MLIESELMHRMIESSFSCSIYVLPSNPQVGGESRAGRHSSNKRLLSGHRRALEAISFSMHSTITMTQSVCVQYFLV